MRGPPGEDFRRGQETILQTKSSDLRWQTREGRRQTKDVRRVESSKQTTGELNLTRCAPNMRLGRRI